MRLGRLASLHAVEEVWSLDKEDVRLVFSFVPLSLLSANKLAGVRPLETLLAPELAMVVDSWLWSNLESLFDMLLASVDVLLVCSSKSLNISGSLEISLASELLISFCSVLNWLDTCEVCVARSWNSLASVAWLMTELSSLSHVMHSACEPVCSLFSIRTAAPEVVDCWLVELAVTMELLGSLVEDSSSLRILCDEGADISLNQSLDTEWCWFMERCRDEHSELFDSMDESSEGWQAWAGTGHNAGAAGGVHRTQRLGGAWCVSRWVGLVWATTAGLYSNASLPSWSNVEAWGTWAPLNPVDGFQWEWMEQWQAVSAIDRTYRVCGDCFEWWFRVQVYQIPTHLWLPCGRGVGPVKLVMCEGVRALVVT